jgi:hypothetical protein
MIESWGGRRFILCIGCALICTVLVWNGKITSEHYSWIILGTVAAYITGNTGQKITGIKNGVSNSENP